MIEAAAVVVCVGIYFLTLTKGKAAGHIGPGFDCVKFGAFVGMFAVFFVGYVLPLLFATTFQGDHPALFFTLVLGGIVVFVLAITMWGLQRKRRRGEA